MNWFKIAKNFQKRNVINNKIKYLEELKTILAHISKLVFQSGSHAKNTNFKIINSSKISSYPILHQILIEADSLALDSPWKFAGLCEEGIYAIDNLLFSLKKEREEFTYGKKKGPKKGWF